MKSKKYLIYSILGLFLSIMNIVLMVMEKGITVKGIIGLVFGLILILVYAPAAFNKERFLELKLEEEDECNIVKNYRTVMIVDNIMDWIVVSTFIIGLCAFILSGQKSMAAITVVLFAGIYIGLKAIIGFLVSLFVKPQLK